MEFSACLLPQSFYVLNWFKVWLLRHKDVVVLKSQMDKAHDNPVFMAQIINRLSRYPESERSYRSDGVTCVLLEQLEAIFPVEDKLRRHHEVVDWVLLCCRLCIRHASFAFTRWLCLIISLFLMHCGAFSPFLEKTLMLKSWLHHWQDEHSKYRGNLPSSSTNSAGHISASHWWGLRSG